MCDVQTLRAFVLQRLTAAAEDIMEQFVRTLANEETLCGRQKLLEAVFSPQVHLQRADVQLLVGTKEEVDPEQQDLRSPLDQDDPPEPPHVKEEQEELQTNQEGELLKVKGQPSPPDVQLLLVTKEEAEDFLPEFPHIREEQEEVQTNQENEQLQELKDEDVTEEMDVYNQMKTRCQTPLNQRMETVVTWRRPVNLSQTSTS
ncbi:uncharacterized protein [Antennarius striatus]|uniref:uncharacterized protein n=1 Tax=Antennarius striatus TaxID=241820 RepID=UPI0035B19F7E